MIPSFGPLKRKDLVRYLRLSGFDGPYSGGRHQFTVKGSIRLALPNPHAGDISHELLARILRQAGISREHWEKLE